MKTGFFKRFVEELGLRVNHLGQPFDCTGMKLGQRYKYRGRNVRDVLHPVYGKISTVNV